MAKSTRYYLTTILLTNKTVSNRGGLQYIHLRRGAGAVAPPCPLGRQESLPPKRAGNGAVSMFYTYILKSLTYHRYYYGSTSDLDRRLKEHNSGRVKSTKAWRLWKLHYHEAYCTRSEAQSRERFFKKRSGYRWLRARAII